ncbi:MAG: ankyrin repeat domain-containing protein [Verrucomicrobia bacterium]|nr:ankyrin repeat domain-containing protein [Verrucomicrobiota bacterium]
MKAKTSILLALLLAWSAGGASAADSLSEAFQKGLLEEEANQNLNAAIQAYQSVLKQLDDQRKLAATTIFRLGECYRKLGKTNEATAQYERVVREFGDQPILVKLSQQNLTALGAQTEPMARASEPLVVAPPDEELLEIEKIKRLLRDSPDLINAVVDGAIPLHKAVSKGWLKAAKFLLENGADIGKGERGSGHAALHLAAMHGHKTMTELLLSYKADTEVRNKQDETPLTIAASRGFRTVVEVLLAHQANPNAKEGITRPWSSFDGPPVTGTALHFAANRGQRAIAELLLAHGAEIDARSSFGQTPLHFGVQMGHTALVEFLLRHKANPDAKISAQISEGIPPATQSGFALNQRRVLLEGFTPLHLAALHNAEEIAKLLLAHQADINSKSASGHTPLSLAVESDGAKVVKLLLEHSADVNILGLEGWSPLQIAVWKRSKEMVELLLAKKPNAHLEAALFNAVSLDAVEIAEMLLRAGAAPDKATGEPTGRTPLLLAAYNSNEKMVGLLLSYKANANTKDATGSTPLHYAVVEKHGGLIQLLLEHGADANAQDYEGKTPLHRVFGQRSQQTRPVRMVPSFVGLPPGVPTQFINAGTATPPPPSQPQPASDLKDMAEMLLAKGANLNLKDENGATPFQYAVSDNRWDIVGFFLVKGADPNQRMTWGDTAMHVVARNDQNLDLAKLLLDRGADVNAKGANNRTALHHAAAHGAAKITELLISRGAQVNAKDSEGGIPLHYAVLNLQMATVELLLKQGASLNEKARNGRSPIDIVNRAIQPGASRPWGEMPYMIGSVTRANPNDIVDLVRKHAYQQSLASDPAQPTQDAPPPKAAK